VTDFEPDIDLIRELRREGGGQGLRDFMRLQIAVGRDRSSPPPKAAPPPPPGHRPGAWPPGTSPPGPPPEWSWPKHLWDAAVRHYRNTENFPDQPCDCGNCPVAEPEENQ